MAAAKRARQTQRESADNRRIDVVKAPRYYEAKRDKRETHAGSADNPQNADPSPNEVGAPKRKMKTFRGTIILIIALIALLWCVIWGLYGIVVSMI